MEFAFGDHVLDVNRRELRRGAELIAVEPQVFDLLVYLVRNRDCVVSKDDLIASVWGGRIVSESTLTSHVHAARKTVGDNGEAQRLIRTLPRKGFRFIGDVQEIQQQAMGVGPSAPTTASISQCPAAPHLSIAVLPFSNLSIDPRQEYFSDGISEELTTSLAKFPHLFVIARNSAFTYKGRSVNEKQIGRELRVTYLLQGSVRREDEHLRLTAQLVDAQSGRQLWAQSYDGDFNQVLKVQDDVTQQIVTTLVAPRCSTSARLRYRDLARRAHTHSRTVCHFREKPMRNSAAVRIGLPL